MATPAIDNTTGEIVDRSASPIAVFGRQLSAGEAQLRAALPSHISPDKFQRTVLTAVQQNSDLLGADRQSLLLSCMRAAQDGLLPDGREAALVIFSTRQKDGQGKWNSVKQVQYMPMVFGLRKKILNTNIVKDIHVGLVYRSEFESGAFVWEIGIEPPLRHRPNLMLSDQEGSDENIIAAYSIATFDDGSKSYEVMSRAEINKVRQASQTGAVGRTVQFGADKGKAIEPKGPWVDWFGEMAKKTVLRRHSKTLPQSGDIDMVDLEGRDAEREIIARSVTGALQSREPDAPVTLPSSEKLIAESGGNDGMGEQQEDEEVALAADREAMRAMDGEADSDQQPESNDDTVSGKSLADNIIADVVQCATVIDVNKQARRLDDYANSISADDYARVSDEIEAARTRLGGKKATKE